MITRRVIATCLVGLITLAAFPLTPIDQATTLGASAHTNAAAGFIVPAGEWQLLPQPKQWDKIRTTSAPGDGRVIINPVQFDERGGIVDATVYMSRASCAGTGLEAAPGPTGEFEVVRFEWRFTAPILRLRPGDQIPIEVKYAVTRRSERCNGVVASRSWIDIAKSDAGPTDLIPEAQRKDYFSYFSTYPSPAPAGMRWQFHSNYPEGPSMIRIAELTPDKTQGQLGYFAITFTTNAASGAGDTFGFFYRYAFGPAGNCGNPPTFHEHISYTGGTMSKANEMPFVGWEWNDRISSVRVPSGTTVVLYEHRDFGGQSLQLTSDAPDLRQFSGPGRDRTWNDAASSFRVICGGAQANYDRSGPSVTSRHPKVDMRFVGTWRCPCNYSITLNEDGTGVFTDSRGGPQGSMYASGTFNGKWTSTGNSASLVIGREHGHRSGVFDLTLRDGKLSDQFGGVFTK